MNKLEASVQWMNRGLCQEVGSDLFFTAQQIYSVQDIAQAKKVCAMCPVKDTCLDYALTARVLRGNGGMGGFVEGVWGATSAGQRMKIRETLGIEEIEEEDEDGDETDHHSRDSSQREDDCRS